MSHSKNEESVNKYGLEELVNKSKSTYTFQPDKNFVENRNSSIINNMENQFNVETNDPENFMWIQDSSNINYKNLEILRRKTKFHCPVFKVNEKEIDISNQLGEQFKNLRVFEILKSHIYTDLENIIIAGIYANMLERLSVDLENNIEIVSELLYNVNFCLNWIDLDVEFFDSLVNSLYYISHHQNEKFNKKREFIFSCVIRS
ncbi:hypothetical protein DLAC_07429 [Tieghemostelium lacteum]|uniref:Uncharacterized protein n=1 Tax=Tieghemostelium lacteum TaxID=361077 RepID=A0A151ZCH5_TIELA|nr:hypothetical protein DLAC_07429 [Tieghemostelium lacteum]|eukprot:KYQ91652.1 hypothetical protein DLAC_07429 [Tieghemostelium lacteum]